MEIEYNTNRLRKILTDLRMIKRYYSTIYNTISARITELKVVSSLSLISHLPPPRKHKLSGDYEGCWSIDVSKNQRLIIRPHESQIGLDESQITKIVILDIVDYH